MNVTHWSSEKRVHALQLDYLKYFFVRPIYILEPQKYITFILCTFRRGKKSH